MKTMLFQTITAKLILPTLLISLICQMINAQNTEKTLLIDETSEIIGKTAVKVSGISDKLNRSAVEIGLKDAQQKLKLPPKDVANAMIHDVVAAKGEEMFGGIKGQHIRHITIDYRVYLYSIGDYQGLIAVSGSKVLAQFVYSANNDEKLQILDDINLNGKPELMIQSVRIDSRGYFRSIRVIELTDSGIEQIFYRHTFDNPIDGPVIYLKKTGSKIYVEKGKTPIFYEEEFESIRDGWKKTKELSKIKDYQTETVAYIEVTKPNFQK
jgi:hypothetical protein